jgi:hypothetical protein
MIPPQQARHVKLTQAIGKRLLVPGHAIKAIETLTEAEVRQLKGLEAFEGSAAVVWLDMHGNGAVLSTVLKDKFGWLVGQIGDGQVRMELRGRKGRRVSVATSSVATVQEVDLKANEGDEPEPVALVTTSLRSQAGQPVAFYVEDDVDAILEKMEDVQALPSGDDDD